MIEPEDVELIRAHVNFKRLKGARVLVTGGSGFIGHWLCAVPNDVKVTPLNRLQYEYGKWDYARWDYIIHLANTPPARVIECAMRCGAPILYTSSGSVESDVKPGEYTLGKIAAEKALIESGAVVKIARPYTFTGACMRNHFAVINMILDAISERVITIRAQSTSITRTYMYAADMAIWLWRILIDGRDGGVYPVGSSKEVTMWQLAREIQKNFTPPPYLEHTPIFFNDPRPCYVPDVSETVRELGVREYTRFSDAIAKTVRHYRAEMALK